MKRGHWILIGQTPVEADLETWARWFEDTDNRRVALTEVPGGTISTVFLGIDHNWGDGPPLLFESMSFIAGQPDDQERYSSWLEAEEGHARMVLAHGGKIGDRMDVSESGKGLET